MAKDGAPSFGSGLCGLSSMMIESAHDTSQVSLFDGFEPNFGDDPLGSIEESMKEDSVKGTVRSSLDETEGNVRREPPSPQGEEAHGTDDGSGTRDAVDAVDAVDGVDGVDAVDEKLGGGDEAHALTVGSEAALAATLASSIAGSPEDFREPSPKRVTFNLEKNEVRIFSTEDGLDEPALGPMHSIQPLLKRQRRERETSLVDTRARTADGERITSLDHLEHLLRVEMAIRVARSNYERLAIRVADTVKALSVGAE